MSNNMSNFKDFVDFSKVSANKNAVRVIDDFY